MKKYIVCFIIITGISIGFIACKKNIPTNESLFNYALPSSPPDYNPSWSTQENWKIHLGRMLFYDKQLSVANTVSCGSCHKQQFGFADNAKFSTGVRGIKTSRNAPTIARSFGGLFWDGRTNSLEQLSTEPVLNHLEMGIENFDEVIVKLKKIEVYNQVFQNAGFQNITEINIQASMARFMSSLVTDNLNHTWKNLDFLSGKAELGRIVFNKNCGHCHSGQSFDNNWSFFSNSKNIGLDYDYEDNGIGALWKDPNQDGMFRVPSLVNAVYTAPYMHDGRFETLEQVVEHYNSGIKKHKNLSWELHSEQGQQPLRMNLSKSDKEALVSFLKSIKSDQLIGDTNYSNPYSS